MSGLCQVRRILWCRGVPSKFAIFRFYFFLVMRDRRPVFFNIAQIAMPIGAITSIMHRITGVLLAFGIPCAVYLLQLSLQDEPGYLRVAALLGHFPLRALAAILTWVFSYHLLAGVRHLLSDLDVGSHLRGARFSAWLVNGGAAVIALLCIGVFF
jgi:succinate dehydrogenase / fumarate reductase cytochrome b subunit